jgi:glycosyltransferase involved in cell wall biosynthesis
MKIAHIITRMDRGGAPDIVRLIMEKAPAADFDMALLYGPTILPSEKTKVFLARLGPKAVVIPSLKRAIDPLADARAFGQITRALREGAFNLVHVHTAKAGILGRLSARKARVSRVVYSPHGLDFHGYFGPLGSRLIVMAERFAAGYCDKIHALTGLEKEALAKFSVCTADKVEVIPSGVEREGLRMSLEAQEALKNRFAVGAPVPAVGFVGRLEPVKGPQFFVEAARRIHARLPRAKFLVIGDGSLRAKMERSVAEYGLALQFIFTGWIEDAEKVFAALDVLLMPSVNEAVGRSALEAQAAGVPVVATRVGGVPEIVRDGVTGLLVEQGDTDAMAAAVLSLLEDPQRRQAMAEAARGWVDEKFSADAMVKGFTDLYRSLEREKR